MTPNFFVSNQRWLTLSSLGMTHLYLALFNVCGHVKIYWVNETSAFVTIEDHGAVPLVKNFSDSTEYSIQSYKSWRKSQKGGNTSDSNSIKEPMEKKRRMESNGKSATHEKAADNTAMTKLSLDDQANQLVNSQKAEQVFTSDTTWE